MGRMAAVLLEAPRRGDGVPLGGTGHYPGAEADASAWCTYRPGAGSE